MKKIYTWVYGTKYWATVFEIHNRIIEIKKLGTTKDCGRFINPKDIDKLPEDYFYD